MDGEEPGEGAGDLIQISADHNLCFFRVHLRPPQAYRRPPQYLSPDECPPFADSHFQLHPVAAHRFLRLIFLVEDFPADDRVLDFGARDFILGHRQDILVENGDIRQLAWRQHDGGHTDGPNWKYFIPWADKFLKP